jgi:starch phosphorylase
MTIKEAKENIVSTLSHHFGVNPEAATDDEFYKAVVIIVRDMLRKAKREFDAQADKQKAKKTYYLCMEFLMGRSLKNNLFNIGLTETFRKALKEFDVSLDNLFELEPDAGLGNGGLGRLAACFLDGLATGHYPAMGYSICYEYGIFKQKIIDGWQTELPDFWLPGGEVWLIPRKEHTVQVKFDGNINECWDGPYHHIVHENYYTVNAVPYDLMVSGYDGKGVSVLRLWRATSDGFDMQRFNQGDFYRASEQTATAEVLSKVLYPADNHPEGKSLRLRQQYFLVSASIQDIVRRHLAKHGTLENLPDEIAIHINDTHPALAIPELMRVMLDECGYGWDDAYRLVSKTIAYTNHTVMKEALECWDENLFKTRLPRIYQIVVELNNRFKKDVWDKTGNADLIHRVSIVEDGMVKMANVSVACGHYVNGVSKLHSEILKDTVFKDFYEIMPEKFGNVTNGIAHRRWLNQSNPLLAEFLNKTIGKGYITNASELEKLMKFADDKEVLKKLEEIKLKNKERLAKYIKKHNNIDVDPNSLFDVQVKRLHEYKRQHLNALNIVAEYQYLRNNPNADFVPKTYIFGAKAAPGYFLAKRIINMICNLSKTIENDPLVRDKLKVVYLEDYRVTLAELLIPAAEISEQISLAGTEASGTGNMKLMQNGALTLGTLDGANVEIADAVGEDNIFIFGMRTPEVNDQIARGYNPRLYYDRNDRLKNAVDEVSRGFCGESFADVSGSILNTDPYMVMADFEDYTRAQALVSETYLNRDKWNKMSLVNIAKAGIFASDRAIDDYARDIWHATPVSFKTSAAKTTKKK